MMLARSTFAAQRWTSRDHDELERPTIAEPHGQEVPNVPGGDAHDVELFSESDDACIDESERKLVVVSVDLHGSRELCGLLVAHLGREGFAVRRE